MALPVKTQITFWSLGLALFVAFLMVFKTILAPFLCGMALAYFLDPVADRLERVGLNRIMAVICISVGALIFTIVVLLLVLPQVFEQFGALLIVLPDYAKDVWDFMIARFPGLLDNESALRTALDRFLVTLQGRASDIASAILASAVSVVDMMVFLIVTPVVAFYLLLDWDDIIAKIDTLLPRDHQNTIRLIMRDLDATMAGLVRGQLSVCAILGAFYAVSLALLGLQFGLIVGVIAGSLTFIPYVGALIGGGLAIGLALFQFWAQPEWILAVTFVFFIGQFLEGNIITPRLVGSSVGLHPVWLLFALSAFGSLMGFTGMLVAVPAAAAIGVLVRFALRHYSDSKLYVGRGGQDDAK